MPERVVSLEEALEIVAEHARGIAPSREMETVALWQGPFDRTLAEEICAVRDQPPFDRSTRDGFAVRARDLGVGKALRVVGGVRAGEVWRGAELAENEAIEIMTGAPLPAGADCVLMVEHAERDGATVRPGRTLRAGENVVRRGAEARAGDVIVRPGVEVDGAVAAAVAGCGRKDVRVYARPKVAVLATGDELVEPGADAIEDWQIYNTNTYALSSMVAAEGGGAGRLPVARDRRDGADGLDELVAAASMFDFALFSGGVSAGRFDLVEQTLLEYGAEFFFTGVRIQPGKPVVFGRLPKRGEVAPWVHAKDDAPWTGEWTYFFGLPGNPVSTEVCFHLFAATMVRALAGRTEFEPQFGAAVAAEEFETKPGLTRLLPCRVESSLREVMVRPVAWQGSGDTTANARANGYCVVEESGVRRGDVVRVLLR